MTIKNGCADRDANHDFYFLDLECAGRLVFNRAISPTAFADHASRCHMTILRDLAIADGAKIVKVHGDTLFLVLMTASTFLRTTPR